MKITLVDHATAYSLWALMVAADKNLGRNVRGLNVYIPTQAEEAANAATLVDIGAANAAHTDIVNEIQPMAEGDNYNYPQNTANTISLVEKWLQASVDNTVVTLEPLYA